MIDVRISLNDVRFTPKSGHMQCTRPCPLWANSGRQAKRVTNARLSFVPLLAIKRPLTARVGIR